MAILFVWTLLVLRGHSASGKLNSFSSDDLRHQIALAKRHMLHLMLTGSFFEALFVFVFQRPQTNCDPYLFFDTIGATCYLFADSLLALLFFVRMKPHSKFAINLAGTYRKAALFGGVYCFLQIGLVFGFWFSESPSRKIFLYSQYGLSLSAVIFLQVYFSPIDSTVAHDIWLGQIIFIYGLVIALKQRYRKETRQLKSKVSIERMFMVEKVTFDDVSFPAAFAGVSLVCFLIMLFTRKIDGICNICV